MMMYDNDAKNDGGADTCGADVHDCVRGLLDTVADGGTMRMTRTMIGAILFFSVSLVVEILVTVALGTSARGWSHCRRRAPRDTIAGEVAQET